MRGNDEQDPGYTPGADTSYETDTLSFGAAESFDAIFTAPAFSGGSGSSGLGYDTYVLYPAATRSRTTSRRSRSSTGEGS
jgi:hypothetical protein